MTSPDRPPADGASPEALLKDIARQPGNPDAWQALGDAHFGKRQLRMAAFAYAEAARLDPENGIRWMLLAESQDGSGWIDEALTSYEKAIELKPDDKAIKFVAATAMPRIIQSDDQIEQFRSRSIRLLSALLHDARQASHNSTADGNGLFSLSSFYNAYHDRDNKNLHMLTARATLAVFPERAWCAPHCGDPAVPPKGRRLKVGIASEFVHNNHTILKLNIGVIERFSRDAVEVIGIRLQAERSRDYSKFDSAVDRSVLISTDLAEARETIAALELDILHYLDIGMSDIFYHLAFARLAHVQTVTWGHPDTTGIASLDYFISSRCLEPPASESQYSERLVRLAGPPTCYRRPVLPSVAVSRLEIGLPKRAPLYACPHTIWRIHPDFDEIIGALLRRDPTAYLVLVSDVDRSYEELLASRFSRSIPDVSGRIIFLRPMKFGTWLGFLAIVDCILDPHTFSGGNTSYEALAMGTPVVTWRNGKFLRARITLALYECLGVDDCIADTADEFVEIAYRLAHDPAWRKQVVGRIEERSGLIFDDGAAGMVRSLERFWISAFGERAHVA